MEEETLYLEVLFDEGVRLGVEGEVLEELVDEAAEAPDVGGLVVLLLENGDLWCPVPA